MSELTQNFWSGYGFKGNPFDTSPLSISPRQDLSIKNGYVERQSFDSTRFSNFFKDPDGGRIVVEGDPGIGKTTYVNHFRYLWRYKAKPGIFTHHNEIQVSASWSSKDFLASSIYHLLQQLRLELGESKFEQDELLQEITSVIGVVTKESFGIGGGASLPGVGGLQFSRIKSREFQVGDVTPPMLFSYLKMLQQYISAMHYAGIILQYDNLEVACKESPRQIQNLFEELRDYIQLKGIHFVFVGHKGFFRQILYPLDRVRSIFDSEPIMIRPLNLPEVKSVIQKRYKIFAIHENWFSPVATELIEKLYAIYYGKIRYIMSEINTLLKNSVSANPPVNYDEAIDRLRNIKLQEAQFKLTPGEYTVFLKAARLGTFRPKELEGEKMGKQVINRILKTKLLPEKFIFLGEKKGRSQFYQVAPDFLILKQ